MLFGAANEGRSSKARQIGSKSTGHPLPSTSTAPRSSRDSFEHLSSAVRQDRRFSLICAFAPLYVQRPRDTEADMVVPGVAGVPFAGGPRKLRWLGVPGAAAQVAATAVTACRPCRAGRRRSIVVLVPAILDPLRNVAAHVVQAERIGRE